VNSKATAVVDKPGFGQPAGAVAASGRGIPSTLPGTIAEQLRDMIIEGKDQARVRDQVKVPDKIEDMKFYGMHRHFTEAGSVLLFGGGMKKGHVHGVTADERPCKTIKNPVAIEDLHATIFRTVGIPADLSYEVEERPFYATRDGKGKCIEWES